MNAPLYDEEHGVRLRLRHYLGRRLAPLALLVMVLTSISAPVAFFMLGRQNLRMQARATAEQAAELVRQDAQSRPLLWKYDSVKRIRHIRSYASPDVVEQIEVVDDAGALVDPQPSSGTQRAVLWQSAPIIVRDTSIGTVWVAASTEELQRESLALLAGFSLLGATLALLIYVLPMRAIGRAQREIMQLLRSLEASQSALSALNESLEHQVERRSEQLTMALRELQDKEKNLRELSSRAVSLQEAERRAIARELHDSAGQTLTAIRIQLQLVDQLLARGTTSTEDGSNDKIDSLMRRTTALVDETVEEIRRAVNTLGPAVLDDVGLDEALHRVVDDLHERIGLRVGVEIDASVRQRPLPEVVETTCYRLVQEALTNVARHANATTASVRIRHEDGLLRILIADDGCGFDPAAPPEDRRGLVGMRERVELLGGQLRIHSAPGAGTRVDAEIPCHGP